jgi:hypothetical protein
VNLLAAGPAKNATARIAALRRAMPSVGLPSRPFPAIDATCLSVAIGTAFSGGLKGARRIIEEQPIELRVEVGSTGWFDERVLYLAPTPALPFASMTEKLMEVHPSISPYGGSSPTSFRTSRWARTCPLLSGRLHGRTGSTLHNGHYRRFVRRAGFGHGREFPQPRACRLAVLTLPTPQAFTRHQLEPPTNLG